LLAFNPADLFPVIADVLAFLSNSPNPLAWSVIIVCGEPEDPGAGWRIIFQPLPPDQKPRIAKPKN
jgi:hypothetical protein